MNNKFSENLKKIRKEHNLSQEQLADELGVSRQAISKWESSQAYPEMDKIIALCDKFNLNIDDLLHRDIKEVKSEEESKNKINKGIDDCLAFITNTINMFSNMSLKEKVKCIIEQVIIIFVLFIASNIILEVFRNLIFQLFNFLPSHANIIIQNILAAILSIVCVIASFIIVIHIFKTRYLDYYNNINNDKEKLSTDETITNEEEPKEEKKELKKDNKKIIIRDPEHSEYRFINGLFKIILFIIKFFCAIFAVSTSFVLIGLFIAFVSSFLIAKTGLFFFGILLSILSAIIITIIILLLFLNFIFNRKNDKKKMIWSFIISLITLGIGIGLIINGALDFVIDFDGKSMLETKKLEFAMKEDTFINWDVNYVEKNIKNIEVEYQINKYCELFEYSRGENGIHLTTTCSNPDKAIKEVLHELNKKKIIGFNDIPVEVTVYASKENIKKMKKNYNEYLKSAENRNEEIEEYEERIESLEEELEEYKEKVSEYENRIEEEKNS